LFLGKQAGVLAAAWLAIRTRIACLPVAASWTRLYGVSLLCGIGFTMSLFIGLLAFPDPTLQDEVKVGVLVGSLLSAIAGAIILSFAPQRIPARIASGGADEELEEGSVSDGPI
jgi:NhaA family Na+:H+ antiporter